MEVEVVMPYMGGRLSVNSMKIVRGGRRMCNFPEVDDWMDDLVEKVKYLRGKLKPPVRVHLFGRFSDKRHPDMHNLHKVVGDALQKGLGINDKEILISDKGYNLGWPKQEIVITIEVPSED